jgi:uncharacterized membrane protein
LTPLIALVVSLLVFLLGGKLGIAAFEDFGFALRCALAVMFVLTASAHRGKRRPDLIRMVPPAFPNPELLVTISGVLELLGAIGLLIPQIARIASICLAVMLVALFPANMYAARHRLTIGGKQVPGLATRAVIQIVFLAAIVAAAWLK